MTTNHHTAIATGARADAATFNSPLGQLDAAIDAGGGGASVSDAVLKAWTEGEDYELTAITYDTNYPQLANTATVKWPDGSAGVWSAGVYNTDWEAIDSYSITHTLSGKTVTQALVTRNVHGAVTVKPALTVA